MGLLWLTMVASFPTVLVGFEWYKQGLSFTQMLTCLSLTIGILLLYSVPVCVIAVRSGLSLKDLMAKLFGPVVTRSLTSLLVVVYLGWYAITALLMADGFTGILGGKQFLPALALVFSILMAFNNFFGFKGVANFAKFVGAPAIICWILYVLFKSAPDVPMYIRQSHDVLPFTTAFCTVSQFLLGFAIWGNEADFWRNGKSKPLTVGLAVFCALFIGEFIFPLTGWLLAAKTGITESGAATAYMNNFAFGKAGLVALLFLASQYFAVNDSNLYAFANGVEAFTKASHRMVVVCLSLLAGVVALVLGLTGTQHALASVCSLSAVLLPTASILISVEWYGFRRNNHQSDLPPASKSVLFAWSVSTVLGILTSDIHTRHAFTDGWHSGCASLAGGNSGVYSTAQNGINRIPRICTCAALRYMQNAII